MSVEIAMFIRSFANKQFVIGLLLFRAVRRLVGRMQRNTLLRRLIINGIRGALHFEANDSRWGVAFSELLKLLFLLRGPGLSVIRGFLGHFYVPFNRSSSRFLLNRPGIP